MSNKFSCKSGSAGQVKLSVSKRVARVVLSNPGKLNAITVSMWHDLHNTFTNLSSDNTIRCIVIEGENGNFAAGADITEFPAHRQCYDQVINYHNNIIAPALNSIYNCKHPVIACIRGVCVGGGLEVALQCDLRFAAHNARVGVPINKLGFPMAPLELKSLLRLGGPALTADMLVECRVFDGSEALSKGLLTRVYPDMLLGDEVDVSVKNILKGAPMAVQINKKTIKVLSNIGTNNIDLNMQEFFG